ncbi:MAG: lysozyme inhibitor LprI family protein [Anaeromyxobacteraceae bacterium]
MTHLEAMLVASLLASAPDAGPSFDCARASTKVERLVCRTPALAALDLELADTYRTALRASPSARRSLQRSQGVWLEERDRVCGEDDVRCLGNLYDRRIAELSEPPARQALPLCTDVAAHARSAPTSARAELVPIAPPLPGPSEPTLSAWNAWGAQERPPIAFEEEPFSGDRAQAIRIHRVPGTAVYAAATQGGTLLCWTMAFFRNVDGHARPANSPPSWFVEDEAAGCLTTRGFASLGDAVVAVEAATSPYDLEDTVWLSRWDGDRFGAPCELRLRYRLTFEASSNRVPEDCRDGTCAPFREAAASVVAGLYEAHAERAEGPQASQRTVGGITYAVTAAREMLGWRVLSAWTVSFTRADTMEDVRRFRVEVKRGELRDARAW